jgi:hypothetical protein
MSMADAIAELAECQHQARVSQHVADHDPADRMGFEREGGGDRRKRDINREVHRRKGRAEADYEQPRERRIPRIHYLFSFLSGASFI